MKTPSKNMGKSVGKVSQKAKDRPLLSIQETKSLIAEGALNKKPKGPHSTFPHSKHSEERSIHYHAKVLGGRQSAAKTTDQLNPDKTITAKRSYPGL